MKLRQIKALLKFAREIYKMNKKGKPGYKTTEFWMVALANVTAVITALGGVIPPESAVVIMAILDGLYAGLRSYVKGQEAKK